MRRPTLVAVALAAALIGTAAPAQSAPGGVSGTVFDSLRTHGPLKDATVMLMELNRLATTDSRGRFAFDTVPAGTYRLTFFHPLLDSLAIGGPMATVTVAAGPPAYTMLAMPSQATLYRRLCGPSADKSMSAVLGRVRNVDDGLPIADATIETYWTEFEYQAKNFKRHVYRATTRTGPTGVYILCNVPGDVPLDISANAGLFHAGPIVVVLGRDRVASRDVAISLRDSASISDTSALSFRDSTKIPVGTGIVRGFLRGADGRPIANAPVHVVADAREARSGADGSFFMQGVPAGTRMLEARAIGYGPVSATVDVPTNGTAQATMQFDRRAQELKPIVVVGARPSVDRSGFAERAKTGMGQYITDDYLNDHPVPRLGDAILRSGNVTYDMTPTGPEIKMRPSGSIANDTRCVPNYYLDGMLVPPPGQGAHQTMLQVIESLVQPTDVKGIELYRGLAQMPAEFNRGNGCGSVVIWTK